MPIGRTTGPSIAQISSARQTRLLKRWPILLQELPVGRLIIHTLASTLRHHLLPFAKEKGGKVYQRAVGNLITARGILDEVLSGIIDVGPLDAYWHMLLRKHQPELVRGIRVLDVTETAPMPAFVASPALPQQAVAKLQDAFANARRQPWLGTLAEQLLITGLSVSRMRRSNQHLSGIVTPKLPVIHCRNKFQQWN